jgi:hypothetical protein
LIIRRQGRLSRSRGRECGHRVDQILYVAVEQGFAAVGGLELLDMVGRAAIPVLDHQLVGRADDARFQIVADVLEPYLVGDDAGTAGEVSAPPRPSSVSLPAAPVWLLIALGDCAITPQTIVIHAPRSTSRNAAPYVSSFFSPTPGNSANAASVCGLNAAIAASVLS